MSEEQAKVLGDAAMSRRERPPSPPSLKNLQELEVFDLLLNFHGDLSLFRLLLQQPKPLVQAAQFLSRNNAELLREILCDLCNNENGVAA